MTFSLNQGQSLGRPKRTRALAMKSVSQMARPASRAEKESLQSREEKWE